MTRYLISFPSGGMDHIPEEEVPDVATAAHAVVQEAESAGVSGRSADRSAQVPARESQARSQNA